MTVKFVVRANLRNHKANHNAKECSKERYDKRIAKTFDNKLPTRILHKILIKMVAKTFLALNSFVATNNHHNFRKRVRCCKIDGLFAFIRNGKTSEAHIRLARSHRIDNRIEFDVLNFDSAAQIIRDVVHGFDIKTHHLRIFVIFIRRELRVGRKHKLRTFGHFFSVMIISGTVDVRIEKGIVNAIGLHSSKRLVHGIEQRFIALRDNARIHLFDKNFFENAKRRILQHKCFSRLVIAHDRIDLSLHQGLHGIGKFRVAFHIYFRRVTTKIRRINIGCVANLHAHFFMAEIANGMDLIGDDRLLVIARGQDQRIKRNEDWE